MPDGALHLGELSEAVIPAAALLTTGFFESGPRLPAPEDFENTDLGALWEAILACRKRKLTVSKINVQRELREMGWDAVKAFEQLKALETRASYVRLDEAVAAIDELFARRLRKQAARVCSETLNDLKTVHDVQAVVERTRAAMSDLAAQSADADHWVSVADIKDEKTERLPVAIDDLDRVTGGLPVGELTIGAGRTGMGKSAFASTLMLNAALQGAGVAAFSLEMLGPPLLHRMASAHAYTHMRLSGGRTQNPFYAEYERGEMERAHLERFLQAKADVQRLPIMIDHRRGLALKQICMGARRAAMRLEQAGTPLRLLVVDHIGKVRPDKTTGNRHLDLGEITESLAVLASELKCAVFGLAQLSREVERDQDKRPQMHHLRESGRIEEDAHTILLFYRPAYYDERAKDRGQEPDDKDQRRIAREKFILEVDVAKNRGGPIKRVPLFCEIQANAILSQDDSRVPVLATGGSVV